MQASAAVAKRQLLLLLLLLDLFPALLRSDLRPNFATPCPYHSVVLKG